MAAGLWRTSPILMQSLLESAPRYGFFQAVRLVERALGENMRIESRASAVRFRPAAELSFPVADIRRCRLDAEGRVEFQLNFLGLYGVDAPVPHYFLETMVGEEQGSDTLRSFCDIFNHRLYELLYLAWRKTREDSTNDNGIFESYLGAFSGQQPGFQRNEDMRFSGILGNRVKNVTGLEGMLSEILEGCPVRTRQNIPAWIPLEGLPALGAQEAPVLGETILGQRILDYSRKIEVRIGPLPLNQALELLPGQALSDTISQLIRQHLGPTIGFQIRVLARFETGADVQLGRSEMMLGINTSLGNAGDAFNEILLPGDNFSRSAGH